MSLHRINWGAIGTFLFVLFVLGVLAIEHMEPVAESVKADNLEQVEAIDVATSDEPGTVRN